MSEERETRGEKQIPLFDGSKAQWPYYKERLESALVRHDMADLLYYDGEILPDNYEFTDEELEDQEAVDEMKKLRKMNVKAAGILLDSIQTKTMDGKVAFNTVKKFKDKDEGFVGGNFKKAWVALSEIYEDEKILPKSEVKRLYYSYMMKPNDKPRVFITNFEERREKMREIGCPVSKEDFINDILDRLPASKDKKDQVGAWWQTTKMRIEDQIKVRADDTDKGPYTLEELQFELEKAYRQINPEKIEYHGAVTDDKDDDGAEKAFAGFGQTKKPCRNCGQWGHKYDRCPKKKGFRGNNNNNNRNRSFRRQQRHSSPW